MLKTVIVTTAAAVGIALSGASHAQLALDTEQVTVSGLSSGGYMATQFHLAHSDWVKGAAVIAAGPYYCGQNSITTALAQCVNKVDTPIDLAALNAQAESFAKEGKIAPLAGLKDAKIWLLHGSADTKVTRTAADLLAEQYKGWVGAESVTYVNDKPFAHHFPTMATGTLCTESDSPFLGNCEYDAAGELLTHLYGELNAPDDTIEGSIKTIDQSAIAGERAATLAQEGFAFVPKACADGEACQIHVSFHGCNQNAEAVGTQFVEGNGINRWADDNHIVVLYPQVKRSLFMPLNPQSCWDWWGYTGADYATQQGPQIQAVTQMIRALPEVLKD